MKFKLGRKILEFDSRVLAEREAKRLGVECTLMPEELPELCEQLSRELDRCELECAQLRTMVKTLKEQVEEYEAKFRSIRRLV